MVKEQWAGLDALRQRLPVLRATLSQVINERRRRGVTLYRKFVAEHQGRQIGYPCSSSELLPENGTVTEATI
jgi:hypothetical protein